MIIAGCCEISRTQGAIASRGITTWCTVTLTRSISGVYWSRIFRDSSAGSAIVENSIYRAKQKSQKLLNIVK